MDWDEIAREHEKMDAEFARLRIEPTSRVPEVGDRVIYAAGLVDRGHLWVREEAEVIAVGETSFKLRALRRRYDGEIDEFRVSPVLITDVLGPNHRKGLHHGIGDDLSILR